MKRPKVNWRAFEHKVQRLPRAAVDEYLCRVVRVLDTYEEELDHPEGFAADFYEEIRDIAEELREGA